MRENIKLQKILRKVIYIYIFNKILNINFDQNGKVMNLKYMHPKIIEK